MAEFIGSHSIVRQNGDCEYRYWEMFTDTYAIQYGEGLYCFLLEGKKRALLIDTGYGRGDFPNIIERLTSKPIDVVNTHGHWDHTGGNAWFKKVHMHAESVNGAKRAFSRLDPAWWENMPYPDYEIAVIDDGYVFDLGERKVECIHTPAHHKGSLTFLDHGQRLLFPGDEFDAGQAALPDISAVAAFLENMKKLKARESEYDFIIPQHNGGPITKRYIDYFIQNAQDIIDGKPHPAPLNDAPGAGYAKDSGRVRSRLWHASIVYVDK